MAHMSVYLASVIWFSCCNNLYSSLVAGVGIEHQIYSIIHKEIIIEHLKCVAVQPNGTTLCFSFSTSHQELVYGVTT